MMRDPLPTAADACSPDADRAGIDAYAHLPDWVIRFLALLLRFLLERMLAARSQRLGLQSWLHDRPDLPPGSIQALAASIRGPFGNAIAWMCLSRGIGPGHKDWPELSRAIVAFGGSLQGFRPGLPAFGLQWWENPNIVPGMAGETVATPAATAMAVLLSRQAADAAPWAVADNSAARHVVRSATGPAAFRRQVFARAATGPPSRAGPPTGASPPSGTGSPSGLPAVRTHHVSYA